MKNTVLEWRDPHASFVNNSLSRTASWLTDPVCFMKEHWMMAQVPDLSTGQSLLHRVKSVGWGSLALLATPLGLLIRKIAIVTRRSFCLYQEGRAAPLEGRANRLSVIFWNIAGTVAGTNVTDAGVTPWRDRQVRIIDTLKTKNADIICLQEVFDTSHAHRTMQDLGDQYAYFYHTFGQRTIGASAGYLIASKRRITQLRFEPFQLKDARGQWRDNGIASFSVQDSDISIVLAHASHSEAPQYPTAGEFKARRSQFEQIGAHMRSLPAQHTVVLGGDLNGERKEFDDLWIGQNCTYVPNKEGMKTWGGDGFCSQFYNGTSLEKPASGAIDLDHCLVRQKGCTHSIKVHAIPTGFDGKEWNRDALSDHIGLEVSLRGH